jgi:hypothetical protein
MPTQAVFWAFQPLGLGSQMLAQAVFWAFWPLGLGSQMLAQAAFWPLDCKKCDSTMLLHPHIAKCATVQWFCILRLQNVRRCNGFVHSNCKS